MAYIANCLSVVSNSVKLQEDCMPKYSFNEAVEMMESGLKMKIDKWCYADGSFVVLMEHPTVKGFRGFYIFDSAYHSYSYQPFNITYHAMNTEWEHVP